MRLLLELQGLLPVREEEHAREERGGHERLRVLGPEGRAHRRQELPELRRVVGLQHLPRTFRDFSACTPVFSRCANGTLLNQLNLLNKT